MCSRGTSSRDAIAAISSCLKMSTRWLNCSAGPRFLSLVVICLDRSRGDGPQEQKRRGVHILKHCLHRSLHHGVETLHQIPIV